MVIIYVYDISRTPITQIFETHDVRATVKIDDVGEAEFELQAVHPANTRDVLQEFHKIKIAEKIGNSEMVLFEGFISDIEAKSLSTKVTCWTLEGLLDRVDMDANGTRTGSLQTSIGDILTIINSRYDTGITNGCDVTDNVPLSRTRGESVLDILKKLTDTYDFTIRDNVLYLSESVGIDRTTGDDYYQCKRSYIEPNDRNVQDFSVKRNSNEIANAIQGKTQGWTIDQNSIDTYGRVEDTISSTDLPESQAITQALANRKDGSPTIEIEPDIDDFFFADIGDTVDVLLDAGNDLGYYNGSAKVFEKSITFGNLKKISVKLSGSKKYTEGLVDALRSTISRVEKLELKS